MTVLLHGFWGGPADWNQVLGRLPLTAEVLTPDLYESGPLSPQHSLKLWADNFARWVQNSGAGQPVDLVGYSMGGRLALHALKAHPGLFKRVLLLSTRAWMDEVEKPLRAGWERNWAEKFLTQPWGELEETWQQQEVFTGTPGLPRRRGEDLRENLALSLTRWSVREHTVDPQWLKSLPANVEWAFGALDQKYHKVAKALQELPVRGQIRQIPQAGHRLHLDAPGIISEWIQTGG